MSQSYYDLPDIGCFKLLLEKIDMARVALEMSKGRQSQVWPAAIEKLKIRWTTDSNALEGSSLTFGDTLFFLQEGLTVKGKPFKDYLDARNHADAVEMLFDVVADGRPVSVGLVKEINALLMSGVRETRLLMVKVAA